MVFMSLLSALRSKGHDATLRSDLTVVVKVTGSTTANAVEVAGQWAKKHEQQLRRELVSELQSVARVQAVFPGGKIRAVRGRDGAEIRGKVEVVSQ